MRYYVYKGNIETEQYTVYVNATFRENIDRDLELREYHIESINEIDVCLLNPVFVQKIENEICNYLVNESIDLDEVVDDDH